MEALSTIKSIPLTKKDQQNYCQQAIDEILSGTINPLHADLHLKAMQEIVKTIRGDKRVSDAIYDEAEKYGKSFELHGVKISLSSRKNMDFTECGDQVYNDLIAQMENLKLQIKAREQMILAGSNPETGEVYNPPKVEYTNVITYKF